MNSAFINIFRSLASWVLYAVLVNVFNVSIFWSASIAIVVTLLIGFRYLSKGFILNWVILLCLIFVLISNHYSYTGYIQKDPWIATNFILAIVAWASLIINKPFTIQYAKEYVPEEKWLDPVFIRINRNITLVWAFIFTLSFTLHLFNKIHVSFSNIISAVIYTMTIGGILFTLKYPEKARRTARKLKLENQNES